MLDLDAYLARIGWKGPMSGLTPSLETLVALQEAHVGRIPFENLDIQMGRPIRLDLDALQAKLVRGGRGGYCFEHNSLFAAVLRRLGFPVILREARVRRGAAERLPRTHLALEVKLPGGAWLADVGFGADGPLGPVPLHGAPVLRHGERNRVQPEGSLQVLQVFRSGAWVDLYALEPGEVLPVDLEMANHYTSTHPASRFVQTLTVQVSTPEARWLLRNLELECRRGERVERRTLAREDLLPLLSGRFGIALPEGTRFRALDGGA